MGERSSLMMAGNHTVYQHLGSSSQPRSCFVKQKDFKVFKVCLDELEWNTIATQLLYSVLYAMLCDERAQAFLRSILSPITYLYSIYYASFLAFVTSTLISWTNNCRSIALSTSSINLYMVSRVLIESARNGGKRLTSLAHL